MNYRLYFLFFTYLCFSVKVFAQKSDSLFVAAKSSNLTLSYNSSLIYPGCRLGVELPIKTIFLTKTKLSGEKKEFNLDRFLTTKLSFYHHPSFHDNLYFTVGWTMRRVKLNGFFTEFSPEIGLSRTFLGGTVYKVDNNANVQIEKLAGYYYALLSIGGGIGYDFEKIKYKPVMIFSQLNVLMLFPYNSTIYLRPTFELGCIYKPSNFLSIRNHSKSKTN